MLPQPKPPSTVKPLTTQEQMQRILAARRPITSEEAMRQIAPHLGRPPSPGIRKTVIDGETVWVSCQTSLVETPPNAPSPRHPTLAPHEFPPLPSGALARPDIRETVRACLTRFDGDRLRLHAAVTMPNHVHALIEPRASERDTDIRVCASKPNAQAGMPVPPSSSPLSRLLKGIKGASARAANQLLGQAGTFWMDESYDHIVRGEEEYRHFVDYIRINPKNAELAPDQYWLHLPP